MHSINMEVKKLQSLTISNEHQTGCALSLAIHQVKGERSLVGDLQRVHEHLNDASGLVEVHCIFLEEMKQKNTPVCQL